MRHQILCTMIVLLPLNALRAEDYLVKRVSADLSKPKQLPPDVWNGVPEISVSLLAQMMTKPKPAKNETEIVTVQSVHDGKYVAYRLRWADSEKSEGGKLAEYSDAVALEFPVKDNANPPLVFMGAKDDPVHLFHWRAQYQFDEEHGKKTVKDIYPNVSVDTYPLEFADSGSVKGITEEKQDMFSHGKAAGNPQSSAKRAVDELMAEGFSTSSAREDNDSFGYGEWKDGSWTVVISRGLNRANGSMLTPGKSSAFAVAVWQGGKGEVGSRKSVAMEWTPFKVEDK